jgi:hypothetical protein
MLKPLMQTAMLGLAPRAASSLLAARDRPKHGFVARFGQ